MKNILESEDTFMAYAKIDFCYMIIEEFRKELHNDLSTIETIIDKEFGHNPNYETVKKIMNFLMEIIEQKKMIEANYDHDEKLLHQLIEFNKK